MFFRHNVKGGANAQSFFEFHELITSVMTFLGIHIMANNKGKFFIFRPSLPVFGRVPYIRIYGPDVAVFLSLVCNHLAADEDLELPWDERFCVVEDFVESHFNRKNSLSQSSRSSQSYFFLFCFSMTPEE